MRWIVLSLLLANLAGLAWQWLAPAAPDVAAATAPAAGVVRLQMPHEQAGVAPPAETVTPVTATESPPISPAMETGELPVQASASVAAVAPASEPPLRCWATAWSASDEQLTGWAKQTAQAERQSREIAGGETWLVFVPAKGGREQMLERLRNLKGLKIESAFINAGDQAGGISLGLFSRKESAERRLAEARALGVQDATVKTRVRQRAEHRLSLRATTAPGPDWQTVACDDVAPGGKPL